MIPWAQPHFWGNEIDFVQEALSSTWISGGPFVEKLEAYFRNYLSVSHALLVANGTAALHLAYLALDITPGDEIILPGFGFLAGANIALHMGAVPVFAEVDPHTWLVTAEQIEPLLTKRTKAIVVIHTYGNVCEMDEILSLSRSYDIPVIEDTAEALGSRYRQRLAGTMGDIGTFSFQATKTVTTGEGGLLVSQRRDLAEKIALYRSHGLQRKTHYWHDLPGHNFRITNLQAALGYAQVQHWQAIKQARQRIYDRYAGCWLDAHGLVPQTIAAHIDPVVWAVAVRLDPEIYRKDRDQIMTDMHARGIETRPGFYPASRHPYFQTRPLPLCEEVGRQVISLPSFTGLTHGQIDHIARSLMDLKG